MNFFKIKNPSLLSLAMLFLFFAPFSQVYVYAGQPTCVAPAVQTYDEHRAEQSSGGSRAIKEEEQLAAAQMRFETGQQPPQNGAGGTGSEIHSTLSFYLSILITFGGLYALIVLLYGKFNNQNKRNRRPLRQAFDYALKPSTALAAGAFLFVAAIIGSTLTSPTAASAKDQRQNRQTQPTGTADSNALQNVAATSKPVFSEVEVIGGDGITQIGAPVFDSLGNRYVRGGFTKTLTFATTPAPTTLTATRDFDSFFAKYDPQGNVLWARQAAGATSGVPDKLAIEGVTALTVDPTFFGSDAVYISGSFVKTITLQGGANPNVTLSDDGIGSGINYESFLAKYDANGNLLWAKGGNSGGEKSTIGLQTGQNGISKIVFDSFGNLYVAGFVSGSRFLGLPTDDYVNGYTNRGKSDIILAKLNNSNGNPIWMWATGGTGNDNGVDLVIYQTNTASGLVLVGGFDSPSISFATTNGTVNYTNSNGSLSTFFAGFTLDGANAWVNSLGNSDTVGVNQVVAYNPNPNFIQIFATGYYKGTLNVAIPFGSTNLQNTRTGTGEAALAGYVAQVDPSNGTFVRAAGLGGPGKALAVDQTSASGILVMGTVWNSGKFSETENLDSLGGDDIYIANIDRNNFSFNWAKTIAGADYEGLVAVDDTADADNLTKNVYNPLGVVYDPNKQKMVMSGDFGGILALDCLKVSSPGISIRSYIAVIGGDAPNCRLWTGRDFNFADWERPDNWNNGIVPSANDSVYINVPSNVRSPILTPASNVPLSDLTIVNRTLTLQDNLTVNNRFDLLAGIVNAGNNAVLLGSGAQTLSTNSGRVIGNVTKQFDGDSNLFTFPVGTANGYSPVTLSNISGTGNFTVAAKQGAYPNTPNLPDYRLNRWWQLTNGGLAKADVTFRYLDGDLPVGGAENNFRSYRIDNGTATLVGSTIDAANNRVTAADVTQFSPWTLAQAFTYEADVQSRPNGDGFIDAADVQQIRRFAVGLDTPLQLNEFQRADASPRSTGGDGTIDDGDVQQARRYSVGTDALQQASGPSSIAPPLDSQFSAAESGDKLIIGKTLSKPALKIGSQTSSQGQTLNVPILVDAKGVEAGYTFGINYDAVILTNPVVTIGSAGGDVVFNANTPGAIGFSVTTFSGRTIAAETNLTLVIVSFTVAANAPARKTMIAFSDTPAHRKASGVDPNTPITQPSYTTGTITIGGVSTGAKRMSGRVVTTTGRGIAGVIVKVTNVAGVVVGSARTTGFGYYNLANTLSGENYVVSVESKRDNFARQIVTLNGNLDGINFTSINE